VPSVLDMPSDGNRAQSAGTLFRTTGGLDATLSHKSVIDKQRCVIYLRTQAKNKFHSSRGECMNEAWVHTCACSNGDNTCRSAIEKLRAQNEQLKHELLLENKFSLRPGDAYSQSLINSLQDEGDNLARKVSFVCLLCACTGSTLLTKRG
jgi:hypothetical protein